MKSSHRKNPRLELIVNNQESNPLKLSRHSNLRRDDRVIKKKDYDGLPLFGPTPDRLPWDFLKAA